MSQASAHSRPLNQGDVALPPPTSRLDRLALALTKPANIRRWYLLAWAIGIASTAVAFCVVAFVLPEGSDVVGTVAFYRKYNIPLRLLSALLALLFLVGAVWSGAFISTLWAADPSRNRVYTWSAIFSEVLVLGLFFVESGIIASTTLLSGHAPDSTIHLLHVCVAVSAALLGPVWIPFTLAALLISRQTDLFPSWFGRLCVAVIVIDLCTVTGVFTLSGPLNGANGIIGAFAGALSPIVWIVGVVAWEVVEWAQHRTATLSTATN
ncbi:hypothetical protein [Mycobacteroides chelonae]|uniref:DUF998 domain-containing protein n=1 Tax=Mycobacteroides chelonae TaxID=1774 RepID=A0A1S1M8F8_MYCCH|nr:hypothetical protein [Mycobacteroides chelonae]OHU53278.1 hypothetical protein BKG81_05500 [Mycobacteroides chelonae]OHU78195.1 hypothetical protein BKG84_07120 [Mycobacteroides chelonae]QQG86621.1 hypothetical protein HBA99_04720 [Mycobacteroides chelonae]QQG91438.1 hypothetical protein HBA97_04720 [Mycobacteroides chelonae]